MKDVNHNLNLIRALTIKKKSSQITLTTHVSNVVIT